MLPERIWIAGPSETMTLKRYSAIRLLPDDIPYIREPEPCEYKEGGPVGYFLGPIMFWTSGCGHDIGQDRPHWTYCPFCGGRIVIKEGEG